jgi:uncharacterized protein (DUF1800 family)
MKATRQKRTPQCESWGSAKTHRDKVARKQKRIDGLEDLVETYELREKAIGLSTTEHESMLLARAHLRNARNQKAAYKPIFGE